MIAESAHSGSPVKMTRSSSPTITPTVPINTATSNVTRAVCHHRFLTSSALRARVRNPLSPSSIVTWGMNCQRTSSQIAIGIPMTARSSTTMIERGGEERGRERPDPACHRLQRVACGGPDALGTADDPRDRARRSGRRRGPRTGAAMLEAMTSRPPVPSVSDTVTRSPMNGSRLIIAPARSATDGDRNGDRTDGGERPGMAPVEHAGDAGDLAGPAPTRAGGRVRPSATTCAGR